MTDPRQHMEVSPRNAPSLLDEAVQTRQALEQLKAQLRESEERYRLLFESLEAGYCVIEKVGGEAGELLDFRYVEANPAFAAQTGLGDVLGKTLRQVLPDEFEERIRTYDAVHRTGEPVRFQREFVRRGRVLELHAFRVADKAQGRVAINLQDVTGRKQAERLLRQNHETFFNLIENAPFGLYIVDAQFRLRQVSTASQKVFSNIDPLIGRDFEEVLRLVWAEPFVSEALGHFRHTLATGEPYAAPNTTAPRQNIPEIESYDWKIERITLPDGQFGVVCYFYDITERKQADEALRESEAFSRSIIKSSPDCIKVLDLEGNLLSMQSGQELLGITDIQPFLNKSWLDFWEGADDKRAAQAAVASAAAGGAVAFVGFFRTLRGEAKWWDVAISPILDANGKPARLLAVSRDVTQRQQAEGALRASEERVGLALDAGELGTFNIELASNTLTADARFRTIFGIASRDVDYEQAFATIHPEDRPGQRDAVAAATRTDAHVPYATEYRVVHPDGAIRWVFAKGRANFGAGEGAARKLLSFDGTVADITERKKAEEVLRQSTAQFETLLNVAPLGVYLVDADFRLRQVNPTALPAFGNIPELIGRDFAEVMHILWPKAQADEVIQKFRHTLETGDACFVPELIEKRADRQTMEYYEWQISRIPLPDGRHGVVCYFRDISERVLAQQKIRESEARYRNLFNSIDEGFCVIEMIFDEHDKPVDFRFLEVNPAFEKQSGIRDATGRRMREIAPDIEAHWSELFGKVALTGEPVRHVNEAKALNDRWFDVYAVRLAGSESRKVAVIFNNITERKQAEEALRHSEERLRLAAEAAHFGTYDRDLGGAYFHVSAQIKHMLGYQPDAPLGHLQVMSHFHPADQAAGKAAFQRACDPAGDGRIEVEQRIVRRDGTVRWISSVGRVLCKDGVPRRSIGFWVDITERKRLEQETLKQTQALAELDRRKDEFLAMLSHELRNPLAALANAVQLLHLQKSEEPLLLQGRSIIERQVGQLKHLVDDLLEVSRITSGSIRLRQERISVSGVVERAVETAQPLIVQHRQQLTLSLPPESVFLHADAARLEQVLVNLLTNAAKYTNEGGHIWLSVEQQDDAVVLRVRDNGIGIEPALLPRIFELFTQAERSLDRSQGGLGIGLCLVQRLVELHGGSVAAHSVLGQGSEFVVRLPLLPLLLTVLPASPTFPAPASDSAPPPAKKSTGCRVLVVDDNVDAAQSMAKLLGRTGHAARLAYDGPSALQAAIDYRPEVVLLDIGLPGLDGYQVAERIRQHATLKNIVLVALTGYGQDTDRQRSQEAGFDHHLVKPSDFDEIENILAVVVSLRKA